MCWPHISNILLNDIFILIKFSTGSLSALKLVAISILKTKSPKSNSNSRKVAIFDSSTDYRGSVLNVILSNFNLTHRFIDGKKLIRV